MLNSSFNALNITGFITIELYNGHPGNMKKSFNLSRMI